VITLRLLSTTRVETIEQVVAFIGEDASGQLALWPRAERTVACLRFGPARFRRADGVEEHLALPGAVLHFVHPELRLATRRYVRSSSYAAVLRALDEELRREEEALREVRSSLRQLDEELLRRLWRLGRRGRP
jgi:F-type H+-transporting ATPase subunit epsilon